MKSYKLEYSLLAISIALLYGIIKQFLPDFPLSEEVLIALFVYVLAKLGVEVVKPFVFSFLVKRGWMR